MKNTHLFQITCAIVLFFIGTGISNATSFSDTSENHTNSTAIEYVKNNGIVSGYPDGTYKPDNTINRAEFTKIVVGSRYSSETIDTCITANTNSDWSYIYFPDVPRDAWYAKYICVAYIQSVIGGYPDGSFKPSDPINFAEAAKIIVNTFNYSVSTDTIWYKPFTEKLGEKKAIPTSITDFSKSITRGEMAEMIYRLKANVTSKPSLTYNSIQDKYQVSDPTDSDVEADTIPETPDPEPTADETPEPTPDPVPVVDETPDKPEPVPAVEETPSVVTCSGGDSYAHDGSYWACVGHKITHYPSGLTATVLSIDDFRIELSLSGLPGDNVFTLIVYKNGTIYIGGNNSYKVAYEYNDYTASSGANITVSSSQSVVPEPEPDPEPSIITSDVPNKFLTLVSVVKDDSSNYEDIGWARYYGTRETEDMQIFDVTVWKKTNPKKVSIYKFDSTFTPDSSIYTSGSQEWIDYRESFNILNIEIPNTSNTAESSEAYLEAFKQVMAAVVENQPAEHYGIKFRGHGTRSGNLFGNTLNVTDSKILLSYINSIIGKKIDFLDWNTQCIDGTYNVVAHQYKYVDYILGSDLMRGGLSFGQGIPPGSMDLSHIKIYTSFFSTGKTIRQSLVDMINSERMLWEQAAKPGMIEDEVEQSISIYDTSKFEDLVASTNLHTGFVSGDVLNYIKDNHPSQEQLFYDFRFHYINNKDFFTWDEDSNGLIKDFWIWDDDTSCYWAWNEAISDFKEACYIQ